MKGMSIRIKITVWFSLALIAVVFFTYITVISVGNSILQKSVRDNLITAVENNVDEIVFYKDVTESKPDPADDFIEFGNGYLKIDDDYLDQVNGIYTALYTDEALMLYGENPISKESVNLKFTDSQIQKIKVSGTLYYIFDRRLSQDGTQGLWLRGIVSEKQGSVQMSTISKISLIIMPLLVLLAIIGGYAIAGRALKPIREISDTAAKIEKGGDLKQRIDIGKGNDELHRLADSFNQMFKRLENAFESERQFTFDASHELRTPVSVIAAECEFTLEQERNADEYREALKVIERQGKKMTNLINDMLDVTRLETRADSFARENVDLSELVASTCKDTALIKQKGITLKYSAESGIHVRGNALLLSRLLTNLISNAYRYGVENGNIFVSLKITEGEALISVEDDGIGIEKDEQDKIFSRFYQTDSSRSNEGTGLGLAMVYEIVQFHKGTIRVESESGKGSRFTVHLPAQQ